MVEFFDHFLDGKVAGVVEDAAVFLHAAPSGGGVQVLVHQCLELLGEAQYLGVLQVAEEVDHPGGSGSEFVGVLVNLADQPLLAVEVGGVELLISLLTDADPVDDVELLPVDCVGIER